MTKAKLRISIPEDTWIHDVSTDYPDVVFSITSLMSSEEAGIALMEIRTPEPVRVLAELESRDDVREFDLLWKRDDSSMVQIVTSSPVLLSVILEAGIPIQTPFDSRDGVATWEITTSSGRLSDLKTQLDEAGIEYEIEYVREEPVDPVDQLLTDRQREVLLAATAQGYYDTPRRATLTEVSESLDISKATGSDVLHRAEGKVMTWFIGEYLGGDDAPRLRTVDPD